MNNPKDVRNRILNIIKTISPQINKDDITDDINLIEAGVLDSLGFLILATQVQQKFDVEIPFDRYAPEDFTNFGKFVGICSVALCEKNVKK